MGWIWMGYQWIGAKPPTSPAPPPPGTRSELLRAMTRRATGMRFLMREVTEEAAIRSERDHREILGLREELAEIKPLPYYEEGEGRPLLNARHLFDAEQKWERMTLNERDHWIENFDDGRRSYIAARLAVTARRYLDAA